MSQGETTDTDQQVAALGALTAELAGLRFTSTSEHVTAEVDGTGVLLRITVAEDALRGAHPERIGPDTVAAIAAARAAASDAAAPRVAELGVTA